MSNTARLEFTDKSGAPLKNARISVKQKTHEFKYGANLFMLDELETDDKNELYKKYFSELFNMATLPFYWNGLEPEKGKTRYSKDSPKIYRRPSTDLCMEFCERYGIEPREHALAYEHFFPDWLRGKGDDEVKTELTRRYRAISDRYADKIPTIEVTNETWWAPETAVTDFYNSDEFVEWCFKEAEKYFPENELVINEATADAWLEGCARNRGKYYMQIERALKKGARIDGIGLQYHMFFAAEDEMKKTEKLYNPEYLYKVMDRYADFNLPVQITEVTVPAYSNDEEDEAIQAEIIENLYSIWFSHKNIEQIIYWNLADGYAAFAPQGDMTAGENYYYGGLLRFDMTPKPAYYTIKNLFEKKWHTETEIVSDMAGKAQFKGFYGKYTVSVKVNGKITEKEIDFSQKGKSEFKIIL